MILAFVAIDMVSYRIPQFGCDLPFIQESRLFPVSNLSGSISDRVLFASIVLGSSVDRMLFETCSAVVVLPHHLGPSINTAPLPLSFLFRAESTICGLYENVPSSIFTDKLGGINTIRYL